MILTSIVTILASIEQVNTPQDLSAMVPIAKEIDETGYKIDLDSFESTKVSKLHMAAIFGENQVAKDLIQNGIGVDTQTKRKITPLHLAVVFHRNEIVRILLENGANPVIKVSCFQRKTIISNFDHIRIFPLITEQQFT